MSKQNDLYKWWSIDKQGVAGKGGGGGRGKKGQPPKMTVFCFLGRENQESALAFNVYHFELIPLHVLSALPVMVILVLLGMATQVCSVCCCYFLKTCVCSSLFQQPAITRKTKELLSPHCTYKAWHSNHISTGFDGLQPPRKIASQARTTMRWVVS